VQLRITLGLVLGRALLLATTTPAFAMWANLTAVALGMSLDAIVAVGMTVLIVSGGFDLSQVTGEDLANEAISLFRPVPVGPGDPWAGIVPLLPKIARG
jgi:ribose/xylose/arabinose/galactoside ABC-type transport system permease subunit